METYICRGRFADDLEYDWLMMMSLDGAVVSVYHVTSWYKVKPSVRALDLDQI